MRLIRRLTAIAALLIGALLPSAATAATLYITEYANIGAIGSNTTPWPPGPSLATQQVAVGGGSLQSAAFSSTTKAIQVICDVGCSVLVGSNPTAATTSTLLQQGVYQNFVVAPGQFIAVIANTAGNTPSGGGGPVTITTCGVAATDLCKAEDAVAASGDTGVATWGVRNDTNATLGADGDYTPHNVDAAGNAKVVGSVASGATDSGNPVKVGGVQNTTPPTLTNGQRGDLQLGTRGSVSVQLMAPDSVSSITAATPADGATISTSISARAAGMVFNGTTWDRNRSVIAGTDSIGTGIAAAGILAQLDDTSTTTVTENQFANLRLTTDRALMVSRIPSATTAVGLTSVFSSALESNKVIKASPGNLYGFSATTGATAGWVLVANSTTAPTAGGAAVAPVKCYVVAANSTLGVTFDPPIVLSTGITLVFSSTGCLTNTASATVFFSGDAK